jgi:hypothetical protein
MIDLRGDIHGHADELVQLLNKLGYRKEGRSYYHSDRKVCFVGDYIDRGPDIVDTLEIVKAMVDNNNAFALMGNHEYNAICFNEKGENEQFLREHSQKNIHQHSATLSQLKSDQKLYDYYIDWFKELPLFHEDTDWRAVHATWDEAIINELGVELNDRRLTKQVLLDSNTKDHRTKDLLEISLKGKEAPLPDGKFFLDKDGHKRTDIRIKWWINPLNKEYEELSLLELDGIKGLKYNSENLDFYPKDARPVFFGHYWLKGEPNLYQGNICCLDYSIAKEGHLAAYSFDGENKLTNDKFTCVTSMASSK